MFCKLPRTVSSAHFSLLSASSFRHLDLLSLLLKSVTKRPVTDLTVKTQAVLSPSTVKRFLQANKLPHKEGHAALTLTCPLCERESSQTASSSTRRPGDWCALRARSTVSWSALVDRVHGAVVYPCTYARMCVSVCVCVEHNCELATAT